MTGESSPDAIPLVDFALRYTRAGFPILACHPHKKVPLTEHGAADATTVDATIRDLFGRRFPHAGLGMALPDLVVLDVDVRDGKVGEDTLAALIAKHGPLPDGPVQRTPSGGWHYLFRARPGARYPGKAGLHVDLKHGRNQYICVDPTQGYGWQDDLEPYRKDVSIPETPRWLEAVDSPAADDRPVAEARTLPEAETARIRSSMRYWGDADDEPDCFRAGMALFDHTGGSEQGFGLWCEYLEQSKKFTLKWAREKWRYFAKREPGNTPVTIASMFHLARGHGWREPVRVPEAKARNPDAWDDPMIPSMASVPEIRTTFLPGVWAEYAEAVSDSTQTSTSLSVMMALGIGATIWQRRAEVSPFGDSYTETLSLWPWVMLPSGDRKSAVINLWTGPLVRDEKLRRDRLRAEIARVESQRGVMKRRIEKLEHDAAKDNSPEKRRLIQEEIRDLREALPDEISAPRHFFTDTTAEACQGALAVNGERFAIITDEGGFLSVLNGIYSKGESILDVFLGGFSGSSLRVVRSGRVVHIDRPAVSIFLAIQPGVFSEAAKNRRFHDSGLLSRVLFVLPESNIGRRDMSRRVALPEALLARYEAKVMELLEGLTLKAEKPRVLPMTAEALRVWIAFAQEIEGMQGPGGRLAHIFSWTARLPGAVARIAGLLQLMEFGTAAESVEAAAVINAVALARLLVSHAEAAFEMLGHGNEQSDAMALFSWIWGNRLTEFSRRDAQRAMRTRFSSAEKLQKAIAQLQEWAIVGRVQSVQGTGGRPGAVVPVNPKLYDQAQRGRR